MAYNRVILLGNLTNDPETRMGESGLATSFSIAVNDTWVDKNGQRQERVNFIECEASGANSEEIAKGFAKGQQILASGRLRQDSWEDKNTGKKRSAIRVVVDDFSFINDGKGAKSRNDAVNPDVKELEDGNLDGIVDIDDIPF
jgi:single-strand DNA-binding protein